MPQFWHSAFKAINDIYNFGLYFQELQSGISAIAGSIEVIELTIDLYGAVLSVPTGRILVISTQK